MKLSTAHLCFSSFYPIKLSRFVPPWERDGKSVEDFFGGLLQRKNPLQHYRTANSRAEGENEARNLSYTLPPEEVRRAQESYHATQNEVKKRQQFLPYGAQPKAFFQSSKMAAWGEYKSSLPLSGVSCSSPSSKMIDFPGTSEKMSCSDNENISRFSADQFNRFYSPQINAVLQCEMEHKIPYRHETCPSLRAKGGLSWPFHGTAGIVLDIDGVVYRSKKLIPGSDEAIKMLQTLRLPFIFMTNGGGMSEVAKAQELSELLHCDIDPDQIVLAHSPMRHVAPLYRHCSVLVVGPPECETVARSYGFTDPIAVERYQCEHPELVPYKKWNSLSKAEPGCIPFSPLSAVFSFSDMTDVMSDVQVMLDVLLSPFGQIGKAVSAQQTIPFYQSADDLLWATEAELPRLGGGAMREMLNSVVRSVTGENMHVVMYGKPRRIAFAYAERQLKLYSKKLGWDPSSMKNIFMVGDNLETDILGANAMGGIWTSVHVLSGIGTAPSATRTVVEGDKEHVWLESNNTLKTPHYIAPTLDHFIRELLTFTEEVMNSLRIPYYGTPNPVDLKKIYNFEE